MEKAVTAFVRIVRAHLAKEGVAWPGRSHVRIIETLTQANGGYSHKVPLWADYREGGRCYDVQLGAKQGIVAEAERLWERLREDVEAVWVRAFDPARGGDHIFAAGAAGTTEPRRCRYGFDTIQVRFREDFVPQRISIVSPTEDGEWRVGASGSYHAGNDRCIHGADTLLTSLTTLVSRGTTVEKIRPTGLSDWMSSNDDEAERVDFYWQERLVHRRLRTPEGWREFSLDDWDNCLDEAFVSAMQRMRRAVPL